MSDMDDIFSSFSKGKTKKDDKTITSISKKDGTTKLSKQDLLKTKEEKVDEKTETETEQKEEVSNDTTTPVEKEKKKEVEQETPIIAKSDKEAEKPTEKDKQTEVEAKPSDTTKTSEKAQKSSLDLLPITPKKLSPTITIPPSKKEYDTSPERQDEYPGTVVTIYALKGHGKTSTAFDFPGKIRCISFDHKSSSIKDQPKYKDKDIIVYNGVRYLDKSSPMNFLNSGVFSWGYIQSLFSKEITDCDWMVIDGGEIFNSDIAEMVMRDQHNLLPFQGTANLNVWKERNMYVDQLLRMCQAKAKLGVIWTCYVRQTKIVKEGEIVSQEDHPKWIDAILRETDVTIRAHVVRDKAGQRFKLYVESSKDDLFQTGKLVDITDKDAYKELVGQ